ncbi:MAG: hypothetical protein JWN73_1907 [Betaproteobacteria bacterium]|nr:hypothetical protein [Betaproteobacteria bacterium]
MNTSLNTEVKGNVPSLQKGQSNVAMLPAVDIIEDAGHYPQRRTCPTFQRKTSTFVLKEAI